LITTVNTETEAKHLNSALIYPPTCLHGKKAEDVKKFG